MIPGYTSDNNGGPNLSSLWSPPAGDYPESLWPDEWLQKIDANPVGWLVVDEYFASEEEDRRRGCVLVDYGTEDSAIAETEWIGGDLGTFSVWYSRDGSTGCENGLTDDQRPVPTEFFIQVRDATGSPYPQIEISLPFLWFWDAYHVGDGWKYVDAAGKEHDLIRFTRDESAWRVEVRVHELRAFLRVYRKCAVLQVDHVLKSPDVSFHRVDDDFQNEWAHVNFHAVPDFPIGDERPSMSRLCGQYILQGQETPRRPRWEERRLRHEYPSFIIGVDSDTAEVVTHTCDPGQLGTYFDRDASRIHYLTPVYFKRTVLQPYVAEPNRYTVTPFHLWCLNLWGVEMSWNEAGLIEVYLGDIGKKIPPEDWGHWRSHNVPPEGKMDEGRFRRDFLNQWASSSDLIGEMRSARENANRSARSTLGGDLWRPLPSDLAAQYRSLIGPLTDDASALAIPLLIMAKVFVDLLDSTLLKRAVQDVHKNEKSLDLLRKLLIARGDTTDASRVLRHLYAVRSRGGVAHLSNSDSKKVLANLGIEDLPPIQAFDLVVRQVTEAVTNIGVLLSDAD
jgi:hypothetical protein